jgi:hypothetical protein
MDMPIAVVIESPVVRFANKAARKIAGEILYPSHMTAAIATPVGGHTGDTFACRKA